ncbi:MAG: ATP-dependent RecD-like DNA helicase [Candidatus Daviesbacteria bacterium]|nr:ATP-dependent RecD-like DNA helicase [Candidatus Daviesbacteria bacterium]
MITLSPDQQNVLKKILLWFEKEKDRKQYITVGGYAGTGKTTLIAILRQELAKKNKNLKVGFASYTGKAARVLKNKLKDRNVILSGDSVSTIHALIYSPIVNEKEEIIGWEKKDSIECNLIIIDEASMVDEMIWEHLLSYRVPVILVGDHGQLPPIKGNFKLMQEPELRLEEIHRQARQNPIIGLSIQAREHGFIRPGKYSPGVRKFSPEDFDTKEEMEEILLNFNTNTLILCGYNSTRRKLNNHIRNALGFESPDPEAGDRVICLRNNHKKQIYNGMLGTIIRIKKKDPSWYEAEIEMDDEDKTFHGLISVEQFNSELPMNFTEKRSRIMAGDLFDFGYALTVHKAQGSQASRVILFEERFKQMTDETYKRWLYTAVTRAEEELYIFSR